jgi:signal transduction histidine kinase
VSQSSSADAAPPDALPGHRGAGSALAPRNWRVACRLIVLVVIPTVLGLALTGLRVTDATQRAATYGQVGRLAVLGQQVTGLAQAMEDERADTAAFLADGRSAAGVLALHRQYVITDGWAATARRLVLQLGRGYPAQTRASAATVLASIAELPGLRWRAAQSQAPALAVTNGYSVATAGLFPVTDGISDSSGNSALITSVRALGSLSRMKDQASQQQAILGAALAEGHFGPGALAALTVAQAQQASDLVSFRSSATPEESWALTDTLASPLAGQARAVEQRAAAAGNGALANGAHASQQWQAGMSYTVGWMRHAEQQLAAWITAYAQALHRNAMRSAIITGGAALAVLILVLVATMIMARSMVRPLRRLEAAALDVAGARLLLASFFRRSHSLLERMLRLIDSLELREDDPERLASLFQMDHLATRMRRNSDSALVLAGHETPRRETAPVTLVDVVRAAVSETEQYEKVTLNVPPGVSVSGSAAADTVHLLAELLENATAFSPKTTQVIVSGHTVRGGGSLISITDCGVGMPGERLRQLNWQLAHPPLADVAVARHMGLFAVAHLAARHDIKVALGLRPGGGTTAEVHLPAALISQDARPGGWPGPAGEVLRVGGGAGAVAADPRRSAPRFAAGPVLAVGPEIALGTQIAMPGAVPLTLGAPLPSPAQAASSAVSLPEPVATELGGALPIFQSVESDYLHTHSQGLLRPSEWQASQPAPPGQPASASASRAFAADGRRAATAGTPLAGGGLTSAGLPQRIPQANLVPGAAGDRETRPARAAGSGQIALGRLASFQRGSRRARAVTRMDRDAKQPAQDG